MASDMRVLIITNAQPHHKYLCCRVAERFNVTHIIRPSVPRSRGAQVKRKLRIARKQGLIHTTLRGLANRAGWDAKAAHARAESAFFKDAVDEFGALEDKVEVVPEINGAPAVEHIRAIAPDVTVNLGGPIYREPLIEACGLMLNYHSGVSPFYNGASTIRAAFSQGHFQMCGGTLMVMNAKVDGGRILAHALPGIEAGDDPETVFMKSIRCGTRAYLGFLEALEAGAAYASVPQPPPFSYWRGRDWTMVESRRVSAILKRGVPARFHRDDRLVEYWRAADEAQAVEMLRGLSLELVGLGPEASEGRA